jgi:hypothetical protein
MKIPLLPSIQVGGILALGVNVCLLKKLDGLFSEGVSNIDLEALMIGICRTVFIDSLLIGGGIALLVALAINKFTKK